MTHEPKLGAADRARQICERNPFICRQCTAPLPNPECGHRKNGVDPCCQPQTENLEADIAAALADLDAANAEGEKWRGMAYESDMKHGEANARAERLREDAEQLKARIGMAISEAGYVLLDTGNRFELRKVGKTEALAAVSSSDDSCTVGVQIRQTANQECRHGVPVDEHCARCARENDYR